MIAGFRGNNFFLSNMFEVYDEYGRFIEYENIKYKTSEHAYVASKTDDISEKHFISTIENPKKAKLYGKTLKNIKPDWEEIKIKVMRDILEIKFNIPELETLLINTGDVCLIEKNYWNDRFWGVDMNMIGDNNLGKLLMSIRNEKRLYA